MYKLSMIIILSVSCSDVLSASDQQLSRINSACAAKIKIVESKKRKVPDELRKLWLLMRERPHCQNEEQATMMLWQRNDQFIELLRKLPDTIDIDMVVADDECVLGACTLFDKACDDFNVPIIQALYDRGANYLRKSKNGLRPVDVIHQGLARRINLGMVRSPMIVNTVRRMMAQFQLDYDQQVRWWEIGSERPLFFVYTVTQRIVNDGMAERQKELKKRKKALDAYQKAWKQRQVELMQSGTMEVQEPMQESVSMKNLTPNYDTMISQVWCPVLDRFPA